MFYTLETAVKIEPKRKNKKNCQYILTTAGNIAKSSKFQPQTLLLGVPQGMIIGLKFYRKKCFVRNCTLFIRQVKIYFGNKFGALVSFHVILQS